MNPTAATKLGLENFDAADHLKTPSDCLMYLVACLDEAPDDAALFAKALGDIARSKGMSQLARDTQISREGLYKALHENGNPSLATIVKVMRALGLRLDVKVAAA